MKLKKVLSMALAGVLALSMLTACGGSNEETSGSETEVGTLTASTGIVVDVQNLLAADLSIKDEQADLLPLTGSESSHVEFATKILNSMNANGNNNLASLALITNYGLDNNSVSVMYDKNGDHPSELKASTTYALIAAVDNTITRTALVRHLYSVVKNVTTGSPLIDSLTVCGVSVSYSATNASTVLESYSLDTSEYTPGWNNYIVVIFTTAGSGYVK